MFDDTLVWVNLIAHVWWCRCKVFKLPTRVLETDAESPVNNIIGENTTFVGQLITA